MNTAWAQASEIAAAVREGRTSASPLLRPPLPHFAADDPGLTAFTAVLGERALGRARALDNARLEGRELGPLAGVPLAVKNLFDIAGLPTLAGSKINRECAPAPRDATLVARLEAAGGRLVGAPVHGGDAPHFSRHNQRS